MDTSDVCPAAVTLALGTDLTISLAAPSRERLLQAVARAAAGMGLDSGTALDVEGASLQLLLAAQRSLGAREARLTIARASSEVVEALRSFRLDAMLPGAAGATD